MNYTSNQTPLKKKSIAQQTHIMFLIVNFLFLKEQQHKTFDVEMLNVISKFGLFII